MFALRWLPPSMLLCLGASSPTYAADASPAKIERIVALDDVCAWPNLQLLPNGDVLAFIFNQPCHGNWEGGIDCWASADGGKTWRKRGVVAPHQPGTNRMNIAAGIAANGDLVVIASGYPKRPKPGPPEAGYPAKPPFPLPLANWVCRSSDGGKTWTHAESVRTPPEVLVLVPFGDLLRAKDGTMTAAFYGSTRRDEKTAQGMLSGAEQMFLATSRGDGKTWSDVREVVTGDVRASEQPIVHEPSLLALDDLRWLGAIRGSLGPNPRAVQLYATEDAGKTWRHRGTLSQPRQFPSHLLRLKDGRILLAHGSRMPTLWGVVTRLSKDEGKTWSEPATLVDFQMKTGDGGYPYSVQLGDGTVVTAYYVGVPLPAGGAKYRMEVVRWKP